MMETPDYVFMENDVAQDIISLYLRCLHDGMTNHQASQYVSALEEYDEYDDKRLAVLALSVAQHNLGRVDKRILADARKTIKELQQSPRRDCPISAKELDDVEALINAPPPKRVKIQNPEPFRCQWQIGDVFAVPLRSSLAEQYSLVGCYLLFQMVRATEIYTPEVLPIVRFKLMPFSELRTGYDQMERQNFVLLSKTEYSLMLQEFRDDEKWKDYSLDDIYHEFEENRKLYPVDKDGFLWCYQAKLLISSVAEIPLDWEYLGNYPLWTPPTNEYVRKSELSLPAFRAFELEECVMACYSRFLNTVCK